MFIFTYHFIKKVLFLKCISISRAAQEEGLYKLSGTDLIKEHLQMCLREKKKIHFFVKLLKVKITK